MAVMTSSSVWVVGGNNRMSASLFTSMGSQVGIWFDISARDYGWAGVELTEMNLSRLTGIQSPVGWPRGDKVASQL